MRTTWTLLAAGLFLSVIPVQSAEPEQVLIQTLLSHQATSFQRHAVILEGVTSQLEISPSFAARGFKCPALHGRASFVLDDETGSLPVDVMGSCYPGAVDALPKEGDRIRMIAIINVINTGPSVQVRAQATTIQILESGANP